MASIALAQAVVGKEFSPSCEAVEGAASIIGDKAIRAIVIGEVHGTAETPKLVGDLACLASQRRNVTVALEFDAGLDADLQRFMADQNPVRAHEALRRSSIWDRRRADGRSSKAMFDLLVRLRNLKGDGGRISLGAFQPTSMTRLRQHYYELAMATKIAELADRRPDDLIIVLVGRVHAGTLPFNGIGESFLPAAAHLPAGEVLTFQPEAEGGTAWSCRAQGCKAYQLEGRVKKTRRIYKLATRANGYDGYYSVGGPYTASEPLLPR